MTLLMATAFYQVVTSYSITRGNTSLFSHQQWTRLPVPSTPQQFSSFSASFLRYHSGYAEVSHCSFDFPGAPIH